MNQSPLLYDMASALESLEPWLEHALPTLDQNARRHFVHLVTGIIEQQSLLVRAIAASSPFQAEPESNFTQVQRIIRDTRLNLETVYYPFLRHILAAMPGNHTYLTLDQTNHGRDFNLVLVGWATDGVSLPLGFVIYPTDGGWAADARLLLERLNDLIPEGRTITLLADRAHASEPFLSCLDRLAWGYVIRLPEDTNILPVAQDWMEVRQVQQRVGRLRVFPNVRIWKGSTRSATGCVYRHRVANGTTTTWYLVTNLTGTHTRFLEYACRWWQECTHKLLKSAFFNWEASRVTDPARVTILLMGAGCACWALWLLGRSRERRRNPTAATPQRHARRQNIIKHGWELLQAARKRRSMPSIPRPMAAQVLAYQRHLPSLRFPGDDQLITLW